MKTLYVLRHGQAAPESEARSDHERSLTARGRHEAHLAAERLAGRSRAPSLIISSSAVRARATAEICLAALPPPTRLAIRDELYLAEPRSYLAALGAGGDPHEVVVVVGHNPGLEALIYVLTRQSEHLATASLVEIELPIAAWSDVSRQGARSETGDDALVATRVDHFRPR